MSEQLGFLLLLLVVGTCNLLLGFVLAAHVGRLRLHITWISIEITAEHLRAVWHWSTAWLAPYLPFFRKKEATPHPAVEAHADEVAALAPAAHHETAPHTPPAEHFETAPSPNVEVVHRTAAPAEMQAPEIAGEPNAEPSPIELPPRESSSAPVLEEEAKPKVAPPTESELRSIRRLAAMQEQDPEVVAETPQVDPLPTFESLASQLEGEFAQLRAEMGQVLKTPVEQPSTGEQTRGVFRDMPESLPCANHDDSSWEDQLQQALQDNLSELQEAARTLQAASAAQAPSP